MSVDKAFEVESLLVNEKGGVLSGDGDPNIPGLNAPVGSFYMRTNGLHYRKTGALDNQWTETDLGSGSGIDILSGVDEVLDGETFTIPVRRQSIIHGLLSIAGSGCLIVEGTLILLGDAI